jgi:hypothetical protein
MLRKLSSFTIVVVALLLIVGCSGSNAPVVTPETGGNNIIAGEFEPPAEACVTDLIAGQHYDVGELYYWRDPADIWTVWVYFDITGDTECSWYLGTCPKDGEEEEDDSATQLYVVF